MEKDFRRMGRAELTELLNAALRDKEALEKERAEHVRRAESTEQHMQEAEKNRIALQNELIAVRMETAALQEKNAALQEQLAGVCSQLDSVREQLSCALMELEAERRSSESLNEALREEQAAHGRAQEKIDSLLRQLSDRVILKDSAGTLADAAIQLNGVLVAAQSAADQYLENIERMHREQEKSCATMEAESRERAEQMIREAVEKCAELEESTRVKCEALKADAEKNVWQKWSSLSEQLKQISNEIHNTVHVADCGKGA